MSKLSKDKKIQMLETLITIRRFEEKTIQLYQNAKFGGYLHPCIGQEAVAVGSCNALKEDDYIVSNHRGHGHCISKGADINKMMAELLGKVTGYCKGRGGSMHIADTKLRMLGANGIVGGGIPISVGAGFGCKMDGVGNVVLCFFGDGASNNGVFHESLNMAAIFNLPVIYICENNMYAISMNSSESVAGKSIGNRSSAYGIPGYTIDGSDPVTVYDTVSKAVKHARDGKGPSLIEAQAYRFFGHHPNDPADYREKEEVDFHKEEKDPVVNFKKKLLDEKIITEKEIKKIEDSVAEKIKGAIDFAEESPEPELQVFLEEVKQI